MLNCYIVDDELHALNILADYIARTPGLNLIGKSLSAVSALEEVNARRPDLAFVDIEMPELSGLALSELFPKIITVVFTTAHAGFAASAFDLGSYDFLLKPIKYERFLKTIQKIQNIRRDLYHNNHEKSHIFIPSDIKGKMTRVNLTEVIYIESMSNYLVIYLSHEKHVLHMTLNEMEASLPENFSRIHRSVIINENKIKSVKGNQVIISEKTKLTVGQNYRADFLKKISQFLMKRK